MEKLQKWAHFAEISGAVAVVVSLLYVGIQVSENTDAQLGETEMNLFSLGYDWDKWYQDVAFVAVVAKANEDLASLSTVERLQFEKHVMMGLNLWEYALSSHARGQIDDDEWRAWNNYFAGELKKKEWLAIYHEYQDGYPEGFQKHIQILVSNR